MGQDSIPDPFRRALWYNNEYIEIINEKNAHELDDLACDALLRFLDYRKDCIDQSCRRARDFPSGEFVDMTIMDNINYIQKNLDTLNLHFIDCRQYKTAIPNEVRVTYLWDVDFTGATVNFLFLSLSLRPATREERKLDNDTDMIYCFYGALEILYQYNAYTTGWAYKHIIRPYRKL